MMAADASPRYGSRMATDQVVSPPPRTGEKLSRTRQRQKLIEACISALYLNGPSRNPIDKVVAIADMAPGIVNFYFETKAARLVAALDQLASEFDERVLAPLAALRDNPVVALERLIELYLDPDIASPRKVSVWYAFWGEASSRREYYTICGKRDLAFADLVRDLVARLIAQTGAGHLDADAVALGLIGALEMMWQEIAFKEEENVNRVAARLRCQAYLRSVFPAQFSKLGTAAQEPKTRRETAARLALQPPSQAASQIDGACEMLVAAELTLAGVPALSVPNYWRGYDVLAQPAGRDPQRIVVKSAMSRRMTTSASYPALDAFDWLAIVAVSEEAGSLRRFFIVPRALLDQAVGNDTDIETSAYGVDELVRRFAAYENNFQLSERGRESAQD